jgi:hypothetical protein
LLVAAFRPSSAHGCSSTTRSFAVMNHRFCAQLLMALRDEHSLETNGAGDRRPPMIAQTAGSPINPFLSSAITTAGLLKLPPTSES